MTALSTSLASFSSQARAVMFYDVYTSWVQAGQPLTVQLEPSNPHDGNSIALWGHLAREASVQHSLPPCSGVALVCMGKC